MSVNAPPLQGLSGVIRRLAMEGHVSEADARRAADAASKARVSIIAYLLDNPICAPRAIASAAAIEFGVPILDCLALDIAQLATKAVNTQLMEKHRAVPLFKRGNRLYVGLADPTNETALKEFEFQSKCLVQPVVLDEDLLGRFLEQVQAAESSSIDGLDDTEGLENLDLEAAAEAPEGASGVDAAGGTDDTPVVKFCNKMLVDAIKRGASDIHFEPYETKFRVRFRMDGILRQVATAPTKLSMRIAARLKVMSNLDIAERRVPQDGRIKLNLSKTRAMDFRVSTCPTLFGEKVVLRVLDGSAAKMGIEKLGYEDDQRQLFLDAIDKPYGMVLVTGPTGSGKTVSLYTALNILNTEGRNISTAEDPVEIRVLGINQVQMNPKQGLTFASALRSFLRQDPDIIMVGEIRDLETAEIAVKAAQTGHMVLSTLHTNDAPQTIARMMNMGIPPYSIISAVTLIIAQRLGRRMHDCKRSLILPPTALLAEGFTEEDLKVMNLQEAVGCSGCNEGYKGRVGIYQVMPMSESIAKIVLAGGNALQIGEQAKREGINDLRRSALLKARNGMMSLTEVNRVTKD